MVQNLKKPTTLKSLYNRVIDSVVSGHFYVDYQRYGSLYSANPKYDLYIHTYIGRGYIRIQSNKRHNWISKYD